MIILALNGPYYILEELIKEKKKLRNNVSLVRSICNLPYLESFLIKFLIASSSYPENTLLCFSYARNVGCDNMSYNEQPISLRGLESLVDVPQNLLRRLL